MSQNAAAIANYEAELRKLERELSSAKTGANVSGIALLLGLVLLFLFWPLGIFLSLAGGLGYLTQSLKKNSANKQIEECEQQLSKLRSDVKTTPVF